MPTLPAGWKPIESAPKNQLVMVYTPPQPSDWPDSVRIGFDYIDTEVADDYWYNHGEHYEHYCCVAKPENCTGPQERAPYTHWMPLPAAPCQTCNGQGAVGNILTAEPCPDCTPPASAQDDAKDERQADACPRCDGSGEITVMSDNSPDAHDVVVCCDHCQGSGAAADAAKYLAAALSGEKYRHMQVLAEYRNFHRSLCARFGYGHDEIHFRRDLVSLEEAIAAKVAAPAAGDARDAERYRWLKERNGGPIGIVAWHRDEEQEMVLVDEHADAAIDAAIAASQQQEG